eukprot:403365139
MSVDQQFQQYSNNQFSNGFQLENINKSRQQLKQQSQESNSMNNINIINNSNQSTLEQTQNTIGSYDNSKRDIQKKNRINLDYSQFTKRSRMNQSSAIEPRFFKNRQTFMETGSDYKSSHFKVNHNDISINYGTNDMNNSINISPMQLKLLSQSTLLNSNKKPKCFIDFDLQLARPEIQKTNAHDNRFEPFEIFPKNSSLTRNSPKVIFDFQLSRDEKAYQPTQKMSDSLFSTEKHINLYKPKPRGILQFSKMLESKIMTGKNSLQQTNQNQLYQSQSVENRSRRQQALGLLAHQKVTLDDRIKEELEKYKNIKGPLLDKQFPRINPKTSDLPIYLQNINGRLAMNNQLGRTLVEKQDAFIDPPSSFNQKKDFRISSLTKHRNNFRTSSTMIQDKQSSPYQALKNRNLTFNQMLAKYGYIEDESNSKQVRKRPWHVKKQKHFDESDEDSDILE